MLNDWIKIAVLVYAGIVFIGKATDLMTRPYTNAEPTIAMYPGCELDPFEPEVDVPQAIVDGAWQEVENRTMYDKTRRVYRQLHYLNGERQEAPVFPGGDLHPDVGVCSDLIVRALRNADYDLQFLIYEDILRSPEAYQLEQRFNQLEPDPNIDHRRVSNQLIYLQRYAYHLPLEVDSLTIDEWQPGDIVIWDLDPMDAPPDHAGIVADSLVPGTNRPYIIQNNGRTQPVDCLPREHWQIVGHFRLPGPPDMPQLELLAAH